MVKGWKLVLSFTFFGLILIIGLISGVSYDIAIYRGVGWSIILFGLLLILESLLVNSIQQPEENDAQSSALDVTLPTEDGGRKEVIANQEAQKMSNKQQIDRELEEMIKNNPERIAELTRKMELD
jgi:flagellar biosynthesis/type III secretory pathway M-ring protein FliF/YscJ